MSLIVANNGAGEVAIRQAKVSGFAGEGACTLNQMTGQQGFGGGRGGRGGANAPPPVPVSSLKKDIAGRCDLTMKIPPAADFKVPDVRVVPPAPIETLRKSSTDSRNLTIATEYSPAILGPRPRRLAT